ncbi:Orexin receptor type 2 [Mizuhopecten yessoensis]|uniref:Orexin receptor type 2 n=1 Tax=Mizuhopecten yessoensis TaxID=6573 RepID=A0A210QZM9_MIZYE|nr:Orexin receptor type 2 [Mizuhopecten yessoensis]
MTDGYTAASYLAKGVPPFMIVFGTFGNILSIFILTRKNIRQSTCTVYLVVLACSDLVVLYTGLLRTWISATFQNDIRTHTSGLCKVHTWLVYVSLDFSAWILVAVTAERVALVWFPHKAKAKCTKKSAAFVITPIFVCLMLINSHILYGMDRVVKVDGNSTSILCDFVTENYRYFFDELWPWVDLTIFCGLPFCFLVAGNVLIITKVFASQRAARRQVVPHDPNSRAQRSQMSSMSIMLICLNCVFMLCTTPVSIYLIGYIHWYRGASESIKATLSLFWTLVNVLMYANNTFNFLLYCMSGSRFRAEVKLVFSNVFGLHNRSNRKQNTIQRKIGDVDRARTTTVPLEEQGRNTGRSKDNNNFLSVVSQPKNTDCDSRTHSQIISTNV